MDKVESLQGDLNGLNDDLSRLQAEIAEVSSQNQQQLTELASTWNNTRNANEQSRQANYRYFNVYANIAAKNLGVIDNAIAQNEKA